MITFKPNMKLARMKGSDWIGNPGLGLLATQTVLISSAQFEDALGKRSPLAGHDVVVHLADTLSLSRDMVFPIAAQARLKDLVKLELAQTLPGGLAPIEFRIGKVETDRKKNACRARVYIVKKSLIKGIQSAIAKQKGYLARVELLPAKDRPIIFFHGEKRFAKRLWEWGRIIGPAGIISVAALNIYSINQALETKIRLKQDVITGLTNQIAESAKRNEDAKQAHAKSEAIAAVLMNHSGKLSLLEQITTFLPEESYLTELEIFDRDILIVGHTESDVKHSLAALQKIPGLEGLHLDGPVMTDATNGAVRFQIRAILSQTLGNSDG